MDECDNLVIDLEEYEALELKQQHQLQQLLNDTEVELLELTTSLDAEDNMGQAESKKLSKKHNQGEIQTKGTAMSFGFRKNFNTTPKKLKKLIKGDNAKKKHDKHNKTPAGDTERDGTANNAMRRTPDSGGEKNATDPENATNNKSNTPTPIARDDNGNADVLNNVHFEKMGVTAASALQSNTTPVRGISGSKGTLLGAGNRFGFRGTTRPSSTDMIGRTQKETNENVENNNYAPQSSNTKDGLLVSNLKRRSKSAHAGRTPSAVNESEAEKGATPRTTQTKTLTFNLKQNSTIEYDRRQFFQQSPVKNVGNITERSGNVITTDMHNNSIIRPIARLPTAATAYTKYTLQTVSLPKPEFAVAISLNATTPTTPSSTSYVSSPASSIGPSFRIHDHSFGRHPLTVAQSTAHHFDPKTVKHMTNSTRRTFGDSREISADSGIASMDVDPDSSASSRVGGLMKKSSPKRSRSRPRNLQMVMNGRGRFEVRDLDDSLSSGDSSVVEPLALPKLPTDGHVPLLLNGLIRSNTVLSRDSYEVKNGQTKPNEKESENKINPTLRQSSVEDGGSVDEEKLNLDRWTTEKGIKESNFKDSTTYSSKTSSPGSSVLSSWCNAGETLAAYDVSTLSLDSSEDSNKQEKKPHYGQLDQEMKLSCESNCDVTSSSFPDVPVSNIPSKDEPVTLNNETKTLPKDLTTLDVLESACDRLERPRSLCNDLNESKFAEMALEGSTFLLDDETSPTDSLVSTSESEGAACKQRKHKMNEELQEKDIGEISPELEMSSPQSPGTPTHCSRSLSLSDCGNLIDDEIADQPALLFNQESQDCGVESVTSRRDRTDTPTLMESLSSLRNSTHSQINRSRSALYQAMELSLRTPLSLRKAVMERAESFDTLSPCESICSDDLMMDFDVASSMDSIDRSVSIKSRSGSDLHKIDDSEIFCELDRKGSDVMKELNSLLRSQNKKSGDRDITAHLPARATRLLNRSRMQQHSSLNNEDSDTATKSPLSVRRRTNTASSRNSTASSNNNSNAGRNINPANASLQRRYQLNHYLHHHQASASSSSFHQTEKHSSSDDLMLYDKSFRNAMIQDVLQFKKQLLRLRKILQETETLNPFESDNGQDFTSCGLDSKLLDDIDLVSLSSSTIDDPLQELTDLRRQVVYLQGQVDDRDRTIRLQKNLIEQLEAEKHKAPQLGLAGENVKECVTSATQTERIRPLSIGTEGLLRSKPEFTSFTTHFPAVCSDSTTVIQHQQHSPLQYQGSAANNQTHRHTIISTTLTNYNHQMATPTQPAPRRTSTARDKQTTAVYKPVKITLIGDPLKQWDSSCNSNSINVSVKNSSNEVIPLHADTKEGVRQTLRSNSTQPQDQQKPTHYKLNNNNNNYNNNNNTKTNEDNPQNSNAHALPYRLHDIMNASDVIAPTKPSYQPHQYHHTRHHHHHQQNNLKPAVTIV